MNIIEISEIKIQFPEAQSKNFSCLIQQLVLPSRQETPLKTQTRDARGKSKPLVWGTAETATKSHKWGEPEHLSGSHCPVSSPPNPNLADGAQGSSTHVEQGEA